MMFGQKHVSVTVCDNGWIVEWSRPQKADDYQKVVGGMPAKTEGKEVFTDRKKLLKYIETKI